MKYLKKILLALGLGAAVAFEQPKKNERTELRTYQIDEDETDKIHRKEHELCLPKWFGKPRMSLQDLIHHHHKAQIEFYRKKRESERNQQT